MAPYEIALIVGAVLPCAAWIGHTPASRSMADAIVRACRMCGMTQKELAIDMGLTPEQLSAQLAGREPLNAWRLFGMTSTEFRRALLEELLNQLADGVSDTRAKLDAVITRLDFLLGSAAKPMVKATLTRAKQEGAA